MNWLVFTASFSAKTSSSRRVALWRELKQLGAISPAGGVQVLPATRACEDALYRLTRDIEAANGSALTMRVNAFEGMSDADLIAAFRHNREQDYLRIEKAIAKLEQAAKKLRGNARLMDQLNQLRKQHARVAQVDYFEAPLGAALAARLNRLQQHLVPEASQVAPTNLITLAQYRGRRWVTRPRPRADALACAWLIRRFIDPNALIRYANQVTPNEVAFDMNGGEFAHHANQCAFERIAFAFHLNTPALTAIGQMVHELDFLDGKFKRPEIAGIAAVLKGWAQMPNLSDVELEARGRVLFEGLYASLVLASTDR
jgi:hypothetical protein